MSRQIYVNLAVRDLGKAKEFFGKLGFRFDPQFSDETGTCMIVDDNIFVMLLAESKFRAFTPHELCDPNKNTEVLVCLTCGSRQEVDEMVSKAVAAGGSTYSEPQDHGFMYGHGFQDLDGHSWEIIYMEPGALTRG